MQDIAALERTLASLKTEASRIWQDGAGKAQNARIFGELEELLEQYRRDIVRYRESIEVVEAKLP